MEAKGEHPLASFLMYPETVDEIAKQFKVLNYSKQIDKIISKKDFDLKENKLKKQTSKIKG